MNLETVHIHFLCEYNLIVMINSVIIYFSVIALATALVGTIIIIIILIFCHWLRVLRIKRLHTPLGHVSLESSPTTSTPVNPAHPIRRALSDSTLNSTIASSSTPTPLLSTPHRYPTRFQKRLLQ